MIAALTPDVGTLERYLAVVGGAALGFVGAGLLVQLLVKAFTAQKVPPKVLVAVRFLGGAALGLVVYALLFGSDNGLGGLGGWGLRQGTGKDTGKENGKGPDKNGTVNVGTPGDREKTVRVEVLGEKAVRRVLGEQRYDAERRYRFAGEPGLHTLPEVKDAVAERRKKDALEGVEIIVYLDSPDKNLAAVTDLQRWAKDHDLTVSVAEPNGNAPK